MPYREHSGNVLLLCADWAYTTNFADGGDLHAVDSRVRDLVTLVKDHPSNHRRLDPHIIRSEAPVEIIANPIRTGALLALNPIVLGPKAWVIIADVHSDCAGFAGAHPDHAGDQYQPQVARAQRHAQHFINTVAEHIGHPMRLVVTWTRFGQDRTVKEASLVASHVSQVTFEDEAWRKDMPHGFLGNWPAFADHHVLVGN